jgi:hypothetical protein
MQNNKKITIEQGILLLSVFTYSISLTQECYCFTGSCGSSFMALIMGMIGLIFGSANLAWLANPCLFISWFSWKKNNRKSLLASIGALVLMIYFLFFKEIISDEAGNYSEIVSYGLGYWLWIFSACIMLIGNIIVSRKGALGRDKQ